MNIALCAPAQTGYSETFIRDHVARLPGRVTVFAGDFPDVAVDGRMLAPLACRLPVKFPHRCSPALSRFAARQTCRRIASVLVKAGTDVVLAEYATAAIPFLEPCRIAALPLVVHFHGYDIYSRDLLARHRREYEDLFRSAAGMVVGSTAMQRHVEALAGSADRVFYNPCGVDASQFEPADPASNPPTFVAVGRFVDKKAPHLTLLAFRAVLAACPDARLVMAGDGPLLEACKQLAQALKIGSAVAFPGSIAHEAAARLLATGRAFVQHSTATGYGDSEGTAISILEAGAAGLPVVATLHGGIRDTVVHGVTGLLVEERDVEAMAAHMLFLARDSEAAREMGRRARQRILEQFTMERSIAGLGRILEQAVAVARRPGVAR